MRKHGGTVRDAVIAASLAVTAPSGIAQAAEASDWAVRAVTDRMKAAPWWVATSNAVAPEEPLGWQFRNMTSVVGFACTEEQRGVFINFDPRRPKLPRTKASLAEGELAEMVRFFGLDKLIEVRTRWDDTSTDMTLVRTPDKPYLEFTDDEEATRLLKGARTFLVEFPWDNGDVSYFEYSLTGSRTAIERAERECEAQQRTAQAREQERRHELSIQEHQRLEQEREDTLAQALEEYIGGIQSNVTRNWYRPTRVPLGLKATVNVVQATNGEVLRVEIIESSGNVEFDRSVEEAVWASSPLPQPKQRAVFDREIVLLFHPDKELRTAEGGAVQERGTQHPAPNAAETAIAALPSDDQAWVHSSCPRPLGPELWAGCVEKEVQAIRAGMPDISELAADDQVWIRSSCPRLLGPALWASCVDREARALRARQ